MTDFDAFAEAMRFLADGLAHEHDPEAVGAFVLDHPKAAALCLDLAIHGLRGVLVDIGTDEGVEALAVYVAALRWREITGVDA